MAEDGLDGTRRTNDDWDKDTDHNRNKQRRPRFSDWKILELL